MKLFNHFISLALLLSMASACGSDQIADHRSHASSADAHANDHMDVALDPPREYYEALLAEEIEKINNPDELNLAGSDTQVLFVALKLEQYEKATAAVSLSFHVNLPLQFLHQA